MSHRDPVPLGKNEILPEAITSFETSVNAHERTVLLDRPSTFTVRGYRPLANSIKHELPRLETVVRSKGLRPSFIGGIDFEFQSPSPDSHCDLRYFTARWQNGVEWTYAHTSQGPIGYASLHDRIEGEVNQYSIEDTELMLQAVGMSPRTFASDDIENLLAVFAPSSAYLNIQRERSLPVHLDSELRLVHDATFLTVEDTTELIQELRFELSHFTHSTLQVPAWSEVRTSHPSYANHIVMRRDEAERQWKYCATYDGPVRPGELTGEYVTDASQLQPPSVVQLARVMEVLEGVVDRPTSN